MSANLQMLTPSWTVWVLNSICLHNEIAHHRPNERNITELR